MKKLLLIVLILAIPALAFADFQVGAVGLLDRSGSSTGKITAADFTYGLETRLNIWIFQAGLSALYLPGDDSDPNYITHDSMIALTDVGVCLDLWILRLGVGLGPNFGFVLDKNAGGSDTQRLGFNGKVTADINLGNIGLGAVGYYYLNSLADLKNMTAADLRNSSNWMLGLTVLFKIF